MTNRQRAWLGYAFVWVPFALIYAIIVTHPSALSVPRRIPSPASAIAEGFSYVLPIALMGVVVWWLTGKLEWPPRRIWTFVTVHVLAGCVFSFLWLATQVGLIAMGVGIDMALRIGASFAGYQAIEGLFVYGWIAAGSHAIRVATRLRDQEARLARADALRMRAELAALRGQLNPHFLFNTLHTLSALVRRDPDTAEHALERFGDMLRYVLDVKRSQREDVTLADELEFLRNYLALEQLRLGDRLRVVERLDPDSLDCVLPSLTLQPLVENAIKYAIAPRAAGGVLEIEASIEGDTLLLEVRDDGPGAEANILDSAAGVGLRAVRQRLETRYQGRAGFTVETGKGKGFTARIALPANTSMFAVPAGATR